MKRFMNKKVATIGLAAGLILGGAGAAFAYFTSTGSGSGSATTGSSSTVNISDNGPFTGLLPGGPAQDITVTATNPSASQSQYVSGITAYLTVTGATPVAGYTCSSADYLLDGVAGTTAGSPVTIAGWTAQDLAPSAHASTSPGTANTIQFNDLSGQNQDSCEGLSVVIHYSSN